ncbi:MFS transporter, partial [Burkholderia pseudomallei]
VPTVRDKFARTPALLSFALLAVAIGSIVALTTNARWIARVGSRTACLAVGHAMSASGALIRVVPTYPRLLAVLALFG